LLSNISVTLVYSFEIQQELMQSKSTSASLSYSLLIDPMSLAYYK